MNNLTMKSRGFSLCALGLIAALGSTSAGCGDPTLEDATSSTQALGGIQSTGAFGRTDGTAQAPSSNQRTAVTKVAIWFDANYVYAIKLHWGSQSFLYGDASRGTKAVVSVGNNEYFNAVYVDVDQQGFLRGISVESNLGGVITCGYIGDGVITAFKSANAAWTDLTAYNGASALSPIIWGLAFNYIDSASAQNPSGADAGGVAVTGSPFVGATLTGSYNFQDVLGFTELGSTYQWNTVSAGVSAPIAGAQALAYAPTASDIGKQLQFCVKPADKNGPGPTVCSSPTPITVWPVVWYTGRNQTGTAVSQYVTSGACAAISSTGLALGQAMSLALYSESATANTTIFMYTGANCTGTAFSRLAGAGTIHNINLDTVGIGASLVSYKISW